MKHFPKRVNWRAFDDYSTQKAVHDTLILMTPIIIMALVVIVVIYLLSDRISEEEKQANKLRRFYSGKY
jgi:protein-S-isoprenylcysteine O-methyltransferase Ste14